jgi:HPt (histidine-containing phosphotransfer) domain-containing protein
VQGFPADHRPDGGERDRRPPRTSALLQGAYGDVAAQLLELFATTAATTLGELRAAEAAGELDEVRRLAHRLKGSARNVGAVGIAELAAALEQGGGPAALDRLEAALEPTRSRLRAVRAAS